MNEVKNHNQDNFLPFRDERCDNPVVLDTERLIKLLELNIKTLSSVYAMTGVKKALTRKRYNQKYLRELLSHEK